MLKINQIFIKLFFLFVVVLAIFAAITYFSLKPTNNIKSYNEIWINLSVLFVLILLPTYFIIKNMSNKLSQDVKEFQKYLEEVSNKNYQAVVKQNP